MRGPCEAYAKPMRNPCEQHRVNTLPTPWQHAVNTLDTGSTRQGFPQCPNLSQRGHGKSLTTGQAKLNAVAEFGMSNSPERVSLAEALSAARETRCLELGHGVLGRTPEVFRQQFGDKPALLVADTNTFAAAGQAVLEAFRRAGHACREPFVFTDPKLYAEHQHVVALEEALKGHDAIPVAVGSGTINDLTKLAAHRAGRPYLAVATAASMDGYTAFGASITYQGSKQTFSCPAPTAVVADLDVICAAPAEMNASGYADLLAKTTAGADWLVADALGVEAIDRTAWAIVQGGLREAVANPAGVRNRDPEAVRQLTEGPDARRLRDAVGEVQPARLRRGTPVQPSLGHAAPRPRGPDPVARFQGRHRHAGRGRPLRVFAGPETGRPRRGSLLRPLAGRRGSRDRRCGRCSARPI